MHSSLFAAKTHRIHQSLDRSTPDTAYFGNFGAAKPHFHDARGLILRVSASSTREYLNTASPDNNLADQHDSAEDNP